MTVILRTRAWQYNVSWEKGIEALLRESSSRRPQPPFSPETANGLWIEAEAEHFHRPARVRWSEVTAIEELPDD